MQTRNAGIAADIGRKNVRYEDIQKGEQGTTLSHPPRKIEKARDVGVNINTGLNTVIEKIHPGDKRRTEAHCHESGTHKTPVHTIEGLLLIEGENGHWNPRRGSKRDHIPQEGHVLTNVTARDPASLVLRHQKMDDF